MHKTIMTHNYETLHDLLEFKLNCLYDIEKQLVKNMPKLARAAHDENLREAFSSHLVETRKHVERLEEAARSIDLPLKGSKVEAIRGLIKDAQWCIAHVKNAEARDVLLISAAQYIEHYEIAGYGAARTWADEMGHAEVRDLLQKTLDEEHAGDKQLTELALNRVNERANDMPTSIDYRAHMASIRHAAHATS